MKKFHCNSSGFYIIVPTNAFLKTISHLVKKKNRLNKIKIVKEKTRDFMEFYIDHYLKIQTN